MAGVFFFFFFRRFWVSQGAPIVRKRFIQTKTATTTSYIVETRRGDSVSRGLADEQTTPRGTACTRDLFIASSYVRMLYVRT